MHVLYICIYLCVAGSAKVDGVTLRDLWLDWHPESSSPHVFASEDRNFHSSYIFITLLDRFLTLDFGVLTRSS